MAKKKPKMKASKKARKAFLEMAGGGKGSTKAGSGKGGTKAGGGKGSGKAGGGK